MNYTLNGKTPQIAANAYVAPGARLIGEVVLEENASVWFNAVLRGDEGLIQVGKGSNIQDNSTCHLYAGYPCIIGENVTVGHNVILHGCRIGNGSLIGMGSIVLDDVEIGEDCFIAAHTLIPPGKKIPSRSFVMGNPGKVVREVTEKDLEILKMSAEEYQQNAQKFIQAGIVE